MVTMDLDSAHWSNQPKSTQRIRTCAGPCVPVPVRVPGIDGSACVSRTYVQTVQIQQAIASDIAQYEERALP